MRAALDSALNYAAAGFPVLPIHAPDLKGHCDCDSADCKSPAKHPFTEHGLKDASIDEAVIRAWWRRWPGANVGIAVPAGYVIVDIDGTDGEVALQMAGHELPPTASVRTGRGVHHIYRTKVRIQPKVGFLPHVDLRGPGSYVVAPPSRHASGRAYEWIKPLEMAAEAPKWLDILGGQKAPANGRPVATRGIPEGGRNDFLTARAGILRRDGLDQAEIEAALLAINRSKCNPPLEDSEVKVIAGSVARYEPKTVPVLVPVPGVDLVTAAASPIQWTLEPIFTCKGVRINGGAGKVSKTTFCLAQMLTAIKGGTLAGAMKSSGSHSVCWFDAENTTASFARKFVAVCRGMELDAQKVVDSGRFTYFNARGLYLDDPSTLGQVLEAIKKTGASEVVFDSLTRIHRQKESDAAAMSDFFLQSVFRIRDEALVGITIQHHHRKSSPGFKDDPADALRGTVDLRNVVDTHVSMVRSRKDPSIFGLNISAQRDAMEAGPFYWRMTWSPENSIAFEAVDAEETEIGETRPVGRPPSAFEQAVNVIKAERGRGGCQSFSEAVNAVTALGMSRATAARAWREVSGV